MQTFYLTRPAGVLLIIVMAGFLIPFHPANAEITPSRQLSIEVNASRVKNNLTSLHYSYTLNRVALRHGQDMIKYGYFSHRSPSGATYLTWLAAGPARFSPTGENLGRNYRTSSEVLTAWMTSSNHRNNILNTKMTHLGTAVVSGLVNGQPVKLYILIVGKYSPLK